MLEGGKGEGVKMGGGAEEEKRTDMTNGEEGKQLVGTNVYRSGSIYPMSHVTCHKKGTNALIFENE